MALVRFALIDTVLADGFRIPKGTYTAFSSIGINSDPEIYPNPKTFDGFRFTKLREQSGKGAYQAPNLLLFPSKHLSTSRRA